MALLINTLIMVVLTIVVTVVLIGFRKHNRKKHNMFSEDNILYSTAEGGW